MFAGTGYISQAVSAGALVTPTIAFGADGPFGGSPTTGTSYALSVTNAASGLSVTDGRRSTCHADGDGSVVVGVVQAGGTFAGQAAFAISIDARTGVVTVEQYLSLHQDSATNTPNDPVYAGAELAGGDGDGDRRRRRHRRRRRSAFGPDQLRRRRSDGADGDGERGDGWC